MMKYFSFFQIIENENPDSVTDFVWSVLRRQNQAMILKASVGTITPPSLPPSLPPYILYKTYKTL